MSLRPFWQFYKDIFLFILASGLIFATFFGIVWGYFLFCSLGLAFGFFSFSVFKKNEYYLYYNLGITKVKLIKVIFVINAIVGLVVFTLLFILFALIFGSF